MNNNSKTTLQIKHKEQIKNFNEARDSLPEKQKSLESFKRELSRLEKKGKSAKYGNGEIQRRSFLKTEIQRLEKDISNITSRKDEMNYFYGTHEILTSYFDREDDSESEEEMPADVEQDNGKEDIMKFFSTTTVTKTVVTTIKPEETKKVKKTKTKTTKVTKGKLTKTKSKVQVEESDDEESESESESESMAQDAALVAAKKESKASLLDRYMTVTNRDYNKKEPINFAVKCKSCNDDMKLNQSDGIFVCKGCGCIEYLLIESDKPNYKEPVPDSNSVATYRRINHLNEILSQIQAKESTDVPDDIFDKIYLHIGKYRIKKKDINFFSMQKILKKLGLRKYYEHASHIVFKINGCFPPTFTREMEDKIRNMFKKIQKPFELYCPKERKNFLSYSYVIHKFCELLELDDYLKYFPLLKNPKKLKLHDRIWKKICDALEWEFYESI